MRGLYKVGYTSRNSLDCRISELSSQTSAPEPFHVVHAVNMPAHKARETERLVHERLDRYRVNERREFFLAPLWKIKYAIWAESGDTLGTIAIASSILAIIGMGWFLFSMIGVDGVSEIEWSIKLW